MDEEAELTLSIAAVERDTGLSKDTLRVWERRYGFPTPMRDAIGDRLYGRADLHKLRILKRLLDAGHRPGRVVSLPLGDLQRLAEPLPPPGQQAAPAAARSAVDLQQLQDLLCRHEVGALRHRLSWLLTQLGLARFTLEVVQPLNIAIGEAWLQGRLQVFEEHLYTELVQQLLRQAIASVPDPDPADAPRVLLTTVPGEPHGLGLLMAEAMMVLEGCRCLSLGVQTPLDEIPAAAEAHRADVVALSFSSLVNPRATVDAVTELRAALPARTHLWVGGEAPGLRRRTIEGVLVVPALDSIAQHVQALRRELSAAAPDTDPAPS